MKDRILEIAELLKDKTIDAIEAKALLLKAFDEINIDSCDICSMYNANNASHGRIIDKFCPCCQNELIKI